MLTPTHQALLALCRVHPSPDEARTLPRLTAAAGVDWTELARLALRGGVAGLVQRNLVGLDVPREVTACARRSALERGSPAPRAVLLQLTRASLLAQAQNQLLLEHGRRLCAAAAAEGLTLIPLKGTALNMLGVYDDPGLRAQCDLDLLVPRDQVQPMDRLLQRLGFEEDAVSHAYELRHSHHLRYRLGAPSGATGARRDPTRVLLELHWTGLLTKFARRHEERQILARAHKHEVRGAPDGTVRMLAPEDLTLLVLLHFCVHRYRAQLKWVVDVAELARFFPALSWDAIWDRARRIGALRALTLGTELARTLLDAPIPLQPRATPLLGALRRLNPVEHLITSQPQPAWSRRALIDLLEYDSPLYGLLFLLGKGTELLERYRGVRLPVLRRHPLR